MNKFDQKDVFGDSKEVFRRRNSKMEIRHTFYNDNTK